MPHHFSFFVSKWLGVGVFFMESFPPASIASRSNCSCPISVNRRYRTTVSHPNSTRSGWLVSSLSACFTYFLKYPRKSLRCAAQGKYSRDFFSSSYLRVFFVFVMSQRPIGTGGWAVISPPLNRQCLSSVCVE